MVRAGIAIFAAMLLTMPMSVASAQTPDELYASGVEARHAGQFDKAVGLLRDALALRPDNADALVQLGFSEMARNKLVAARDAFSKALALAPGYADAQFGLAGVEFRAGNLDKALALVEPVAKSQPDNKDAAALMATIRKARAAGSGSSDGKTVKPVQAQARARRADPVVALMARGRGLRGAGRLAEAERVYRRALRLAPRDTDVLVALGLTQGAQQKFDEADRSFDAALKIHPGLADAMLGKVRLAMWRGDIAQARALLDGILPSMPRNVEALALDARIAMLEGDDERALRSFEQALVIEPDDAEALTGIGDIRRAGGDDEAARQAYRQALALEPGSKDIADRLARPPPRKWRLDIGSEVSDLTGGRGTWTDSSIGIAYRAAPRTTVSARVRPATRDGLGDVQIEGRIDQAFSSSFSGYGLVAGTPDAAFLARYSLGAGASWQALPRQDDLGPLFFNIDARYDGFADKGVATLSPWVQAYFLDGRLGLSARWVHAFDDRGTRADGYVLRADLVVTPDFSAFIGYGDAPEIDEGVLTPTRTLFGGASLAVSDDVTLRASLAHEQRPAFDRTIFGFGFSRRF